MVRNNSIHRKEHNGGEGGLWLSKCNVDPVEVQETQKRPRGRLDSSGARLHSGPFHATVVFQTRSLAFHLLRVTAATSEWMSLRY